MTGWRGRQRFGPRPGSPLHCIYNLMIKRFNTGIAAKSIPGATFMFRSLLCGIVLVLVFAVPSFSDEGEGGPPTLAIGSTAPDFCLPGVDGQTHCLKEY